VQLAPPVQGGIVDGAVKLRGTLRAPELDANVQVHGLKRGKLDRLDVMVDAHYRQKRAQATIEAALRGAPLLTLDAAAPLDAARISDRRAWETAALTVDATVPGYPLARLRDLVPQLDGTLTARVTLRGTIAQPTGELALAIVGLQLGRMRYDRFSLDGALDGRTLTGKLDAHQLQGGALAADASLPIGDGALVARLRASGFQVDLQNMNLTNPRLLQGRLDATVDLSGTRAQPVIAGQLHFSDGKLGLAADPRLYDRIMLDLQLGNGSVALRHLEAHLGDGKIEANGTIGLQGLAPQSVDLKAHATRFPVEPGQVGVWVDADLTVHGQRDGKGLSGTITVDQGTANLPKLAGGKKLQSTGPLEDVRFVEPAALAAEQRRKEAEKRAPTTMLTADIPGPFHVRGKELSLDLKGRLHVALSGPVTRISGHVEELATGWIELLGRRYSIEKAHVDFGGEAVPDPELDVRLTRDIRDTTLVIEVRGTAKKPKLQLASDPPIYDQSQVIAAILSGDPGTRRVDDRSLDQKVTGAVSSIIVGKIKDQIAPNLPIDVVKVDTGNEGATGIADTRIEVGKYLTDTIYVSYVHQFGSLMVGTQRLNSNEANLNWRFYKRLELETAFGDAAVGHVNIFWSIRF
jgi:translocation and assembly module TamB